MYTLKYLCQRMNGKLCAVGPVVVVPGVGVPGVIFLEVVIREKDCSLTAK